MLLQGDAPVRIGGRALDILTALIERPGELVSKSELMARVWPGIFVLENNLKVNIGALRRALGDETGAAKYVGTVQGRGYRFIAPVEASSLSSSSATAAKRSHNLPIAITRIFGRADAIDAIRLDLEESRLVSIVGAGGIGKTRVALAVAEQALGSARDGVWLVDLAPLKDPALVPNAVATSVGLGAPSTDVLATLCESFRSREMLILFDSCERLIEAAATCVDRILAEAPGVKILATSREPLRTKGERVRRLTGLGTPPTLPQLSAEEALAYPAVQLFVDRATDGLESFTLRDRDAPIAAEICRRLDGLALAIELAATRVHAFGVEGLLAQLDDRFRLLAGHRAGPERHRTLTATIGWSYELLSENERAVMRRLSTFVGAFSLDSACAVAIDERIDRVRVVENLANLVAKSLVAAEAREVEVEYRLFDTTRSYALDRLAENNELESARRRHAQHFLELAVVAEAECDQLPRSQWLARYGTKIDDIRHALSWAGSDPIDAALTVRLTVAAIPFWRQLFLVEECRAAVERVLDIRFALYRSERDDLILRMTLGRALFHTYGSRPEGKSIWAHALKLAENANDVGSQIQCLTWLSNYQGWACEFHAVIGAAERIRTLAIAKGDLAAVDAAAMKTGMCRLYLGELDEARLHLERAIRRSTAPSWHAYALSFDFDPRVTSLGGLAILLWLQGYADQAIEMSRLQRAEAQKSNDAITLLSAIVHVSCPLALEMGDLKLAGQLLDFVEKAAIKQELRVWNAMATCLRGKLLQKMDESNGLSVLRDGISMVRDGGFRIRYPIYLAAYADGLAQKGDKDAAHSAIDEAISLCGSRGQAWCLPEVLRIKGNVLQAEGKAAAETKYLEAIECARRQGALSWELRAAINLVDVRRKGGESEQAETMLKSACGRFSEGFWTADLRHARSLLGQSPTR
jgi:predicted ATPase/DNA-binding winged helix-turn-helix (wHTH) protein